MHIVPHPSLIRDDGSVLDGISARAAAADRGDVTLADGLAALHHTGLSAAVVADTAPNGNALRVR